MQYGHFDDKSKEYVITNYETPLPWINYLGSDSFFTLLSNTAGGYAFYKDARLRRITRYRYNNLPLDQDGFHIYIKDKNTIWNPGWQPTKTKLDHYECHHGLGYTTIIGPSSNSVCGMRRMIPPTSRETIRPVKWKSSDRPSITKPNTEKEETTTLLSTPTRKSLPSIPPEMPSWVSMVPLLHQML